jgi:anti-sigma B factor antagonist
MGADERQGAAEDRAGALSITATRLPGEAVVIGLHGELDMASCPAVSAELEAWRGTEPELCLDLSRITFIDSQGLHLLLAVTAEADDGGPPVGLLAPSETVMQVVEVTGTARRLGLTA